MLRVKIAYFVTLFNFCENYSHFVVKAKYILSEISMF